MNWWIIRKPIAAIHRSVECIMLINTSNDNKASSRQSTYANQLCVSVLGIKITLDRLFRFARYFNNPYRCKLFFTPLLPAGEHMPSVPIFFYYCLLLLCLRCTCSLLISGATFQGYSNNINAGVSQFWSTSIMNSDRLWLN